MDPLISTPGREGLTGTAPASAYTPPAEPETITRAPDGRPMDEQPAWRTDFPIDTPQDQFVARRDFMKFMVLTSLAFTVGQFWIAGQNWLRQRRGLPPVKRIGSLTALAPGGTIEFAYPGEEDRCVLVRTIEGELVAYSQECTHLSCAVIPQPDAGRLYCPCHEGIFDMRTGRVLAGPPQRPLPRIVIEQRGDEIYATGVETRTA